MITCGRSRSAALAAARADCVLARMVDVDTVFVGVPVVDGYKHFNEIHIHPAWYPLYPTTQPGEHFSRSAVQADGQPDEWLTPVMARHADITNKASTLARCASAPHADPTARLVLKAATSAGSVKAGFRTAHPGLHWQRSSSNQCCTRDAPALATAGKAPARSSATSMAWATARRCT